MVLGEGLVVAIQEVPVEFGHQLATIGVADPAALSSIIFAAINSAAARIYQGNSFILEAATLEKFVIAGVEAALV